MTRKLLTPDQIEETFQLREQGWTYRKIGERFSITPEAVSARLASRGKRQWIEKKCELPECNVIFKTMNSRRRCCCRKHIRRIEAREVSGWKSEQRECALPECNVLFQVGRRQQMKMCCSSEHMELNSRRLKGKRGGLLYRAVLGLLEPCMVCGEKRVVDEHHIHFPRSTSKSTKTVHLCPTHHFAIHRGLAHLEDGKFVWLVDRIREGLIRKQPKKVNQLTNNWEEAKP
jgi:hypothetical protein